MAAMSPARRPARDPWDFMISLGDYAEGVTRRSQYRVLAPLHIVVRSGGSHTDQTTDWYTLCTAAPALAGLVHYEQKRCPACLRLAVERTEDLETDE